MKTLVVAGLVAVVVAVPFGYNIRRRTHAQLAQVRQRIAQEHALQQTQTEIIAAMKQADRYRKRLPSEPNASWLVNEVVALSEQANVPLSTITQSPPQIFPQLTRLAIEIECMVSYHQLGDFLDRLERAEPFIQVEHLEILSKDEQEGALRVRLALSTVYLTPAADTARSH